MKWVSSSKSLSNSGELGEDSRNYFELLESEGAVIIDMAQAHKAYLRNR